MSKKNKKVAKASLFAMMTDMWADVRSGKVDAKSINLTKYAEKYHVGKFKRSMILPYIMQETCPTYEQACELRRAITPKEIVIGECIEYLKKEGYVIFKKV